MSNQILKSYKLVGQHNSFVQSVVNQCASCNVPTFRLRENQVESFKKFAASMGESVHGVMAVSQDMTKRMQTRKFLFLFFPGPSHKPQLCLHIFPPCHARKAVFERHAVVISFADYKNQYQKAGAAFLSLANSFPDSDMRPGTFHSIIIK